MEKNELMFNIFAYIGMAVCIIIALIAIVWATCFAVKLLAKTFGVRVGKSYEVACEDITKKSEAKKERNEIKRKAAFEQKTQLLNMKLESKQKIHEMKMQKLAAKLEEKERQASAKYFGDKTSGETLKAETDKEIVEENPLEKEREIEAAKKKKSSKQKDN